MNELELNNQLLQQDFILKVSKQLEKDINRCGYDFNLEKLNPFVGLILRKYFKADFSVNEGRSSGSMQEITD